MKNDDYKRGPSVPIPLEWFKHCAWCDQPVDRNGPAVLMVGAVAHGPLPTDCPNTRSNGTSRPNRGPSSTTTLDEPHGRNYGRVANGGT